MVIENVRLDWLNEHNFLLKDRDNFPIVMGKPMGASAADLLPLSLIGCSSHDVIGILQKQRQNVTDFQVSAQSERDAEAPWRFRKIHVHYKVIGHGVDPQKVGKAIKLSQEQYCGVYVTLKDAVEITSDFEVIEG
jgi:putative redox protein